MSASNHANTGFNHLHIEKPTLVLDKQRAVRNIERMATKAQKSGVRFRPHFKTHRSAAIGEWFREFNVSAIAVSSVDMALYFARHGWNDIIIAFREGKGRAIMAKGRPVNKLILLHWRNDRDPAGDHGHL